LVYFYFCTGEAFCISILIQWKKQVHIYAAVTADGTYSRRRRTTTIFAVQPAAKDSCAVKIAAPFFWQVIPSIRIFAPRSVPTAGNIHQKTCLTTMTMKE